MKTLIAKEGGVQLVCNRLEELVARHTAGELNAADTEVEALMKQACELVIIVLTGGTFYFTTFDYNVTASSYISLLL